ALTVSLLLHAGLLLLPLPGPRQQAHRLALTPMVFDLVAAPVEHSPVREERQPPLGESPADEPARPAEQEPPETRRTPAQSSDMRKTQPLVALPDTAARSEQLRAQLLSAARALGRQSEQSGDESGLQYDPMPDLPSPPGWLHRYTGPVSPSNDRWKNSDGSHNARVVTAGGRVICIRTRAPTMAEIFNPWMSSAVPMVSLCGRERPDGVAGGNPWIRPPGGG
ncbi:MAG TPA: hypothetical protein VK972_04645, partial [Wenzhouxiangella sp.]|nr:hypothetical protein [Wenzhouxiangella sp.]